MRHFIGIDPGLSGAIALLAPESVCLSCVDTPTAVIQDTRHRDRREYALADMRRILSEAAEHGGLLVALEAVHAFPDQGASSTFALGRGFGIWLGLLAGLQIPFILVNPMRWKARFQLLKAGKQGPRLAAQQRWPNVDLHLKKHDGRADALYLAEFARLMDREAQGGPHGASTTSAA